MWQVSKYHLINRFLGFTFGIKLKERGEEKAQANYAKLIGRIPEIDNWIHEEEIHELKLLAIILTGSASIDRCALALISITSIIRHRLEDCSA